MNPNFQAGSVDVEDMGDYLFVGFADHDFGPTEYLSLQRAHEFDEQDRKTGMDNVYFERNDQGWSCYGGIQRFELQRDRVRVFLNEHGTRNMAGHEMMEIQFTIGDEQFAVLRQGLAQCFRGFDCYHEDIAH